MEQSYAVFPLLLLMACVTVFRAAAPPVPDQRSEIFPYVAASLHRLITYRSISNLRY